jgi:acetolactate synthase-1/2/3 large subunit
LLANHLLKTLKDAGVDVYFGVQGGACARLIQEINNVGAQYIPVLNEQSAGYMAHGYYLATGKIAGITFTTGPGFTNAISGIATCYYDNVPMVVLAGQVSVQLNKAKHFGVKMVGFQEMPHSEVAQNIVDFSYVIDSVEVYKNSIDTIRNNISKGVSFIEINDDIQRSKLDELQKNDFSTEQLFSIDVKQKESIVTGLLTDSPIIILGAGIRGKDVKEFLDLINETGIPVAVSWGAQHLSQNLINSIGIFGTHAPGSANSLIKNSTYLLAVGVSLLQHQAGKVPQKFCPNANIDYVNINKNEAKRAADFFGKRFQSIVGGYTSIFDILKKVDRVQKPPTIECKKNLEGHGYGADVLEKVFEEFSRYGSIAFSDAGATLSWSYQAVNKAKNKVKLYTAFNLHPMGYSNCAAVGASIGCGENEQILAIIGDGSLPMNCQELAHLVDKNIKLIVLDNEGYGIIRQTQDDFYESNHLGSSFTSAAPLPKFSVKCILQGFNLKYKSIDYSKDLNNEISSFFSDSDTKVLIINLPFGEKVEVDMYG